MIPITASEVKLGLIKKLCEAQLDEIPKTFADTHGVPLKTVKRHFGNQSVGNMTCLEDEPECEVHFSAGFDEGYYKAFESILRMVNGEKLTYMEYVFKEVVPVGVHVTIDKKEDFMLYTTKTHYVKFEGKFYRFKKAVEQTSDSKERHRITVFDKKNFVAFQHLL